MTKKLNNIMNSENSKTYDRQRLVLNLANEVKEK